MVTEKIWPSSNVQPTFPNNKAFEIFWNCGSPTKPLKIDFLGEVHIEIWFQRVSMVMTRPDFTQMFYVFWVVGLNICRNPCITMVSCRFPICILPFLWCSGKPCLWLPMVREGSPLGSCGSHLNVLKMGCSMLENEQNPSRFKASNLERP